MQQCVYCVCDELRNAVVIFGYDWVGV